MVISRNKTYLLFSVILFLALTKGVAEIFNVPLYILVLVPTLIICLIDLNISLALPKFAIYRLVLGLYVAVHGGRWDFIIGFTYVLTGLILSLIHTHSSKDDLSRGYGLVSRLLVTYIIVVLILSFVSPSSVYVLDRGIDWRFAGFAGDPNFLAIISMLVIFGLFKRGPLVFTMLILILMLTQSRSALIVLAVLIAYDLKKRLRKHLFPLLLSVFVGLALFISTDFFDTLLIKLRLDKIAGQSRATNLWFPVLRTIDYSDISFWIFGKGAHYAKDILGVYLHSSWIELFVEYGFIGVSLAFLELRSLWNILRKGLSRLVLVSFVIVNMLFSIHWGIFALCLLSLSIVIEKNEIYS